MFDDDLDDLMPDNERSSKKKKKPVIEAEGMSADLISQLSRSIEETVEERLQLRVQKSLMLIRFALIVVFVILAPAAWFAVKNFIHTAVENVNREVNENVARVNKEIADEISQLKKNVNDELLYLKISHDTQVMQQRITLQPNEVVNLVEDLEVIAQIPAIKERPGFMSVVEETVNTLLQHGYEDVIEKIGQLFPDVMPYSENINEALTVYYGMKVLSRVDVNHLRDSIDVKRFEDYSRRLSLNKGEIRALPMQILVSFHLEHDQRNAVTTSLLNSVVNLGFAERAQILWNIMRGSDPLFWQQNPTPTDFRIAKVANEFVRAYQSDLFALANSNGVKETIVNMYEYANRIEDIRLGKHILYYFYKISVD